MGIGEQYLVERAEPGRPDWDRTRFLHNTAPRYFGFAQAGRRMSPPNPILEDTA